MLVRPFACVVVLATLIAPNLSHAECKPSDRPANINSASVAFYPTSDTTLHVSWGRP